MMWHNGLQYKYTIEDITPEFLVYADSKLVWVRDDYLSMLGYEEDKETLAILEKVVRVKEEMRIIGHIFSA